MQAKAPSGGGYNPKAAGLEGQGWVKALPSDIVKRLLGAPQEYGKNGGSRRFWIQRIGSLSQPGKGLHGGLLFLGCRWGLEEALKRHRCCKDAEPGGGSFEGLR